MSQSAFQAGLLTADSFESAEQVITSAGALTIAHGLSQIPRLTNLYIVCQTAEGGYSIGDELLVPNGASGLQSNENTGVSVVPDATNFNIRYGSESNVFWTVNKTTGVRFATTNANWTFKIKATTSEAKTVNTDAAVAQVVTAQDGAVATGATIIPNDDTIPQNTEGTEFITLVITATKATNKLIIDFSGQFSASASIAGCAVALFQDSVVDALAANSQEVTTGNNATIPLRHTMTAGTVSPITFRIRAGGSAASTITFNGAASARLFGGVSASTLVVQEIEV